jgi:uncharacterized protein (TIGR03437 family)
MDALVLRRHGSTLLSLMVALTVGPGALKATNLLTATPSSTTLTCNTQTGTTPATIVVKAVTALTGSNTIVVSYAAPTGGLTISPANATLNAGNTGTSGAGVTFTVGFAAGCVGVTNAATPSIQFKQGSTNDVTQTLTTDLTATNSGLVPSPSSVTVTCVVGAGPSYTPGPAQVVSVLSTAANTGTPFTVVTSGGSAPSSWLTVTGSGGTATTSTAVSFSVQAAPPCASLTAGQTASTTVHLASTGVTVPDKLVSVTLQALSPSPLTAISPVTITYVKGSGSPGKASVNVASVSVPNAFFAVDTTSLPAWLTVDYASGTAPKTIQFSSTTICDSLAPGTYNATGASAVRINVSGYGPLSVSVSLLITNSAPKLTVAEGTTRNLTWTIGHALPTPVITATSSDTPIPYTVTTGGILGPIVAANQLSGLAYSFGTPIDVTFNPLVFAAATPNSTLTGTVTLSYGTNSSIVVTFNVSVLSPASTVTGLNPASLPTAAANTKFTLGLTGTGFIVSSDPTQATKVGVVQSGTTITPDPNISWTVVNGSNITLVITVNASDTLLPFSTSGNGGNVTIGVCNPSAGTCSIATGTATLTIGSNPIIQAVTSSSALVQVTPPTLPTISTYDMVSVFGANFCSSGGTGCGTNTVLYGEPDPVLMTYPTTLSPDASGPTQRNLYVTFFAHGGSTVLGTAPLLFATNGQINLLVPSGVSGQIGSSVDMVVNFGYGTGANLLKSAVYTVNLAATDPGVFTVGADGQGSGAILDQNFNLVTSVNPSGARATSTDSDIIQLYMTGLGIPDSTADDVTTGGAYAWSADCVSPANYLTAFNAATANSLATLDGALIVPSPLIAGRLVPCLLSGGSDVPTVTVGGQPAVVKYAGWVAGTVAGLYQVNVQLPSTTAGSGTFHTASGATPTTLTIPVQLPVVVTAAGNASQAGVTVWVNPALKVEPIAADVTAGTFQFVEAGTVGVAWASSNNQVVASEGTAPYHYAVTSGVLPAGLTLNPTTGGVPAANTNGSSTVTVTVTDSAAIPLKGTATFTLTIAADLYLTNTTPYGSLIAGTGHAVSTMTASSGIAPYTYTITSSVAAGIAFGSGGSANVLSTSSATPAGNYTVTVGATDSTTGTALTGSDTFPFTVALNVTKSALATIANGASGTLTTISVAGSAGGTPTFALDATTLARGWIAIDSSGNITLSGAVTGTWSVTVTVTDGAAPTGGTAAVTPYTFSFTI